MENNDSGDIDWAAIIDLLASEYGWTIDYVKNNLDLGQVVALKRTIQARYDQQNGAVSEDNSSVPSQGDENLSMSDFETKLGGKKVVHDDGTVEIII